MKSPLSSISSSESVGPAARAARRPVRDAARALAVAAGLTLLFNADALPGWLLDIEAPILAYEAARALAEALAPLRGWREALTDAAASLRPGW